MAARYAGISGLASITGPVVLGEGADQSVTGTITDLAGNSASVTVSGINIDKTAPIALPGGPNLAKLNEVVAFDSSGSSDHIDTYAWLVNGSIALTGATPTLSAAQVNSLGLGAFEVRLTVTDLAGNTGTD